jgi:hypothetical protein
MSRNSSATVTSASYATQLRYRLLVDINSLTNGNVHACTGGNFIMVGANTYTPVGGFGGLDPVTEAVAVFPRAIRFWLAAVNTTQIVDVVNENFFNKQFKVWRAFLTDSLTIVDTPQLLWVGRGNTVQLVTNDPARGNYYEVEAESRIRQVAKAQYFDQWTQQMVLGYSGDTFFDYIPQIPLFIAPWGHASYGIGAGGSVVPGNTPAAIAPPAPVGGGQVIGAYGVSYPKHRGSPYGG